MFPSLLNVTKEKSHACGSPNGSALQVNCNGEDDVIEAWTRFLEMNNSTNPAEACINISKYKSFADRINQDEMVMQTRFPGQVPDSPTPVIAPGNLKSAGVLVPQSWLDESEENFKTLLEYYTGAPYNAFGGATVSASDQANSLSQAHRNAATMVWFSLDEHFWSVLFPKMFDISDKTNFPPVFGSNHADVGLMGPRKDNWTAVCPAEWTFEERKAGCISFQESIYGTERLNRLEAIKKAVDPNFMFDCQNCIGNNRHNNEGMSLSSGVSYLRNSFSIAISSMLCFSFISVL